MPTLILSLSFTDKGIRVIKEAPQRAAAARDLARSVGVELGEIYLTTGDSDLLIFAEAPDGDNIAKFALAPSSLGNVRTKTARA